MLEIMRHTAGSRLFGTNTPNSDTDYKAVHLPSRRMLLLGDTTTTVTESTGSGTQSNTKDDTDFTSFPFQKFIQLLTRMEVNALETFFAKPEYQVEKVWNEIVENKHLFMSATTKDFVGYASGQANRYAVRGKRLDAFNALVAVLSVNGWHKAKLSDVLLKVVELPEGSELIDKPDGTYLSCYGRSVPVNGTVDNAISTFQKPIDQAGKRAIESSGGTDWKGVYHAHRVIDEGLMLFQTGTIQFPLHTAPYLLKVRNGELELEDVLDNFEEKAKKLETLTTTVFQASVDQEKVDDFIVYIHDKYVL